MEDKIVYICDNCGHKEFKWTGRCPSCGTWNSFSENKVSKKPQKLSKTVSKAAPLPLSSCGAGENTRIFTGIEEIDRVLGGGIMKGSSIMIGGEPGIGKSTLMLLLDKLYLLDEVTVGMDPVFRLDFYKILQKVIETEEASVLMTSHIESEMKQKTDFLGILDEGRMTWFGESPDFGEDK